MSGSFAGAGAAAAALIAVGSSFAANSANAESVMKIFGAQL